MGMAYQSQNVNNGIPTIELLDLAQMMLGHRFLYNVNDMIALIGPYSLVTSR